jgi:DNA-binding phage protein
MNSTNEYAVAPEDIEAREYSLLEDLYDETRIASYLDAVMLDIQEGECEPSFFFDAITDILKARIVNQLTKDAGMNRAMLCSILDNIETDPAPAKDVYRAIAKATQSFAIPVTA